MSNGHLIEAVRAHCEQQEHWAHADFYWHMNPATRKVYAVDGQQPWRGAMSPSILHIINIMEEMGHYEPTGLSEPEWAA